VVLGGGAALAGGCWRIGGCAFGGFGVGCMFACCCVILLLWWL
jgi:hypothetical protein